MKHSQRPRALFSFKDYPGEAVRQHFEGTAIAELTIGKDGLPKACRITKSSGHKVLDDRSCEVLMARPKFKPAKDENGNQKEDTYDTPPIIWSLPN